ncbi:hypothetical protein [Microvirga mediterraneensis]|uniref:Uncharacterized protein n=1 Tax=Microvirga mediterraneensis TaxID=2754695 RepID=A0A838BKC0_9HYPH|nr:hypothetical protein [Microvirga mediterraneensis]MBA1154936.1 hypothetical protein [Microvirga mediterraneensis]
MNIFDFITQDEIDDLPDDDPQAAFIMFVRIAQRRLGDRTAQIDDESQGGWRLLEDARYGFVNVVVAAAKKYEIEPFISLEIPKLGRFDDQFHRQFRADLDHYITQLLLDNSSRAKRDSVSISSDLKAEIRSYLHHLREAVDRADLSEAKRSILLRKLAEFEAELEKKRLNMVALTTFAITILSAPGGIWATAELAPRLVTNILRLVGEAKEADDASRRIQSAMPPKAITGPRREDSDQYRTSADGSRYTSDLDDDIPF